MFTDLEEVGFDQHSVRVPITELHLDQKVIDELQAKKEQVVNRQQNEAKITPSSPSEAPAQSENQSATQAATGTNKKKNKKKSRKNKGLKAFMDGDAELQEYNKAAQDK